MIRWIDTQWISRQKTGRTNVPCPSNISPLLFWLSIWVKQQPSFLGSSACRGQVEGFFSFYAPDTVPRLHVLLHIQNILAYTCMYTHNIMHLYIKYMNMHMNMFPHTHIYVSHIYTHTSHIYKYIHIDVIGLFLQRTLRVPKGCSLIP